MKTRLLVLAGLAIGFAISAFAQQKEVVDPKIIEGLSANGKKFAEAFNNNDAAALAALYTEDAIFVTDRGIIHGRPAIEVWWADTFNAVHPKNYSDKADPSSLRVVGTADNIRVAGEWNETLQGKNGEPIQAKGYWSDILVREGDDWEIQVDAWNVTPGNQ
jgi:ketosteroid isomerase-like protein